MHSFTDIIVDAFSAVDFSTALSLFFVFIIISSDVFINSVLARFSGAVDMKTVTNYGSIIQAVFLAMAYIIIAAAT